ncbi:MAG: dCTP deaminase, partial [Candidatus Bilamarchaeaceae archaeon]
MALSDVDIKKAIKEGRIKITPLKDDQIGPGSVDLTLSNEWYFFKKSYLKKTVDLSKVTYKDAHQKIKADAIILPSGGMCLGKTVEKITLAPDIMGTLEGRSRYARMGLSIHITAAIIQPGSNNRQVLEIVNLAPFPV